MKIRAATAKDLPSLVHMLADDPLGKAREKYVLPLPHEYVKAFTAIEQDSNQELIVLENNTNEIIAMMQLTFIPYLTYRGGIRAQLEGVRVRKDQRGKGLGSKLLVWAIKRAKQRKAHVLQLTTDKKRPEAIQFYAQFGFIPSHEGMKLHLPT